MDANTGYAGKVLVVGATGKTGQWVVKRLSYYGIPARVFSRERGKEETRRTNT